MGTLWASRVPVLFAACCGASLSLSPSQPVLFSQSAYPSTSLSVSCLSEDGPTTVAWGTGRGGEQQGSAASVTLKPGPGPRSGSSADSSGAAARIDGAQGLGFPRDPSSQPCPGKHRFQGWGWGQAEHWWGVTQDSGVLTSILSLVPSSCFPLIWATLWRAFRVRSSLLEERYQRTDSAKNLWVGGGGGDDFSLDW